MIYDCFLYSGEEDQLVMRVKELDTLDVTHVMVQGTRTFQGAEKHVVPVHGSMRNVVVDDWPEGGDPWRMEQHQRDAIVRGLDDAQQDDYVIVSDADEIPRASTVRTLIDAQQVWKGDLVGMRHTMYYFAIDLRTTWRHDFGPVLARVSTIRERGAQYARWNVQRWAEGGWHFSYLGGPDAVVAKMRAYAHTEFADVTREHIARCIEDGIDYDGRGRLELASIDGTYPACIRDNPERWKHLRWENVR